MLFSPKRDRSSQYQDPTGEFSNRELAVSSWYVRHKLLLERVTVVVLIVWSATTIGYSLFRWGEYLIVGYTEDQRLFAELARPLVSIDRARFAPQDIQIQGVNIFESASERYDFVARVRNPNPQWLAYLRYHFTYGHGQTPTEQTVLLPQDDRPIIFFGHKETQSPQSARLVIEGVEWQRLDPHRFPKPRAFIDPRLQFLVTEVQFEPGNISGLSTDRVQFVVTNESAYSYWDATLYAEFLDRGTPIGYAYVSLPNFRMGDTRSVDLRLFANRGTIGDVIVYPVMNVFNPSIYQGPGQ